MIDDHELRALVREAIARHVPSAGGEAARAPSPAHGPAAHLHASHSRFTIWRGGDADGACLIEPAVRCNHCGYCQSYGH